MKPLHALALVPMLAAAPALADIFTWVDKGGLTHVSNLPPPEDARVLRVSRAAPRDPEREAAMREAQQQAEVRALDERMRLMAMELEESRRQPPPPPVIVVAPPAVYYAPPPAPVIVNVVSPPAPDCAYGWGDCGVGSWGAYPVFYPSYPVNTWFGRGGKGHRKGVTPHGYGNTKYDYMIPPLVPPPPTRQGGRKGW
jgi:hypothetical protein